MRKITAVYLLVFMVVLNHPNVAFAANEPLASGCTFAADKIAIALPLNSIAGSTPTCNGGYPFVLCKTRTICKSNPGHEERNNLALTTNCMGMIVNGQPSCDTTFVHCCENLPAGAPCPKSCPLTADMCANGRGIDEKFGVNFQFRTSSTSVIPPKSEKNGGGSK